MSEVLETTALDADQNRYVKTLKRSAEALLELINDVLDIAKIESGQMQMVLTEFDLWSFVQRLADVTAFRAQQKGLEFICYIAPDVPRFVTSDANRLRQVLANILGNAVKFTASGEIILRLELKNSAAADPMLNFSVSDTGIGIAERRLEMIFDKFSQAEPEISSDYGGTGLGLSICKSLVQLLGGTIEVKSRLGIGSTFGFSLPLSLGKHNQSETYPLSAAPIAVARKNAKPRLLVVDDMGDNRLVLRVLLGQSRFAIEEAADGGEAVQKHKGDPFDLIFMDLRMTPVDGCTAVESIRDWERTSGRRPVPIVVVTAHALKEDLDRAYLAGCSDHLIKPVNRIRLHQVLAKFSLAKDGIDSAPVAGTIEPLFGLRFNDYVQNRRADMSLLKTALQAHDFSQIRKLSHHNSGTAGLFALE
jgi:CheY-like chemotaxis protein/two-component sensor histidine kinase